MDPSDITPQTTNIFYLMVAILSVFATVIAAIFGTNTVLAPAISNLLYPKYPAIEATILLAPNSSYDYCIHWQGGQAYTFEVSTQYQSVPIWMRLINSSSYTQWYYNKSLPLNSVYSVNSFYTLSTQYKPPEDDDYYIFISRAKGVNEDYSSSNKTLVFNISVEASRVCSKMEKD
jgi:hypothetical protein